MPPNAVQTYIILLCGKLTNYPEVENCVSFQAIVSDCVPTIVAPTQGSIADITGYKWYDPAVELDLSSVFSQYQQDPPCNFQMTYATGWCVFCDTKL